MNEKKRHYIFYYEVRFTDKFHPFTIKNNFGNASESGELRFVNSLLLREKHYLKQTPLTILMKIKCS